MLNEIDGRKVLIPVNIAICDDNPAFLDVFQQMLEQQFALKDWVYQYNVFRRGADLLSADLSDRQVVFLDIDMPGIDGLDTARQLRASYPDLIIVFVTAFPEYAVQGYYVEALRYLLKNDLATELPACLDAIQDKLFAQQESILVQTLSCQMKVRLKDVLYFEGSAQRHVFLHTYPNTSVECLGQLTEYEHRLGEKGFLRVQRSYLVNMLHINDIRNYKATLSNGEVLKVSEQSYSQICKQFLAWRGQRL